MNSKFYYRENYSKLDKDRQNSVRGSGKPASEARERGKAPATMRWTGERCERGVKAASNARKRALRPRQKRKSDRSIALGREIILQL